jgi:Fur family ferric uptake transcriptional regulator
VTTRDWQATLRERGYRLTPQRELVLRAVDRLGHATPDEVLAAVREESQAVNISTVYRTLELLEGLGLVRHNHSDRAPTTTHRHARPRPPRLRMRCDHEVAPDRRPDRHAPEEYGFTTDIGHLTIFCMCSACGDGRFTP